MDLHETSSLGSTGQPSFTFLSALADGRAPPIIVTADNRETLFDVTMDATTLATARFAVLASRAFGAPWLG